MGDLVDLPYKAEYSKSGRAACKGCKTTIVKDCLRLATMVRSPMFDGKVPHWYHYACFFLKQRPKCVGDIANFESLRWDDQEKIKSKLEEVQAGASSSAVDDKSKKSSKRKSSATTEMKDYKVEYSKSSRAICRGCEEKIIKGDLRAAKKDYESEEGRRFGGIPLWHHFNCFVKLRHDLEFCASGTMLPGYKSLKKDDQNRVSEALPEVKSIKKEEPDEEPKKKKPKPAINNILKKQSKTMFGYRDQLKELPKKELVSLLEYNDQDIPPGLDSICDSLADVMTFGALLPCSECRNGQFVFRSGIGYFCEGNKDEWVKCERTCDEPPRKPFKVPDKLKEKYDFLANYKCNLQKRVFENHAPSATVVAKSTRISTKSVKSELEKSGPKIERNLPLKKMQFAIVGKLSKSNKEIKLDIMRLGGVLTSHIHDMTTAVISTQKAVENKGVGITEAELMNIQVVPESFIDECKNGAEAIECINRLNLVSWGSDPANRLTDETVNTKSKSLSGRYKSKAPTKQKLKIKDGVAVDPDSGLEDVAHVYRDQKNIYNCALSLTDLQRGRNSFYKLQILESDSNNDYWLFRSWGRIGTTIGGTKLENMSRQEAIDQFKVFFEDKTANMWDNRENFRKVPGKMVIMDICYDDDDAVDSIAQSDTSSRLEKPVQDLVSLIFNVSTMKDVMKEMELDLEKMPLGKLSKKQIREAFQVLTRLQDTIQSASGADETVIISCTNQFFTLIPHDFGIESPPLLNDLEIIRQKVEMVDALMEIEIAYSLLKESTGDGGKISAIDSHYIKLNTELSPLSRDCPEFKDLELYVRNTHAETHRNYKLKIVEVFKVERHGEQKRFKPFKKLHNRKLLWHGSRLTNYVSILSQGLRIAPPEAPVTGYMFGKGIYFADMVSKSANYCMTSPANNTGLLLLCEVALGNMHELKYAENIVKPPKGMHSVKGIGKTHPDPSMSKVTEDGVEIPLGKGIPSKHDGTSLLYNEYIVYDVAQVKVQYLVQTKFEYTY